MDEIERFRGCLLGLAAGDAVGTTVEFSPRGTFEPVTDMVGGGPFNLRPGEWTDDTSMALCLATSLLECGRFDAHDQMERYCRWATTGYLSSNGRCFDIGGTVSQALDAFQQTGDPFSGSTDPWSAGNGCIMRLAPVPMFFHRDFEAAVRYSGESSRTTHGARECVDASRLFGAMIVKAFSGSSKKQVLFEETGLGPLAPRIADIASGTYREKGKEAIKGSGYVVECLEAALWCFLETDSFQDAVLAAVNLGDDADTTGAVCGQIAGAFYGESLIPLAWRRKLAMGEQIGEWAERLYEGRPDSSLIYF
jgi:ADP-ribosyl-[dinitrogen reductase] hydrolase